MTPTTPLAGLIFGLVAGLLMVAVVLVALRVPKRRPAPAKAWSADEQPTPRSASDSLT